MNTAWVVVMVLVLGGGKAPETKVVLNELTSMEQCQARAEEGNSVPTPVSDEITGRPILSKTYVCTSVSTSDLQDQLNRLQK